MELSEWCGWYKRRGAGRLRRLLMREWDPIGVGRESSARDEYDSYLGLIADRLRTSSGPEPVRALLEQIAADHIEMPRTRAADLRTAEVLVAWHKAEMARLAPSHRASRA